MLGFLKTLLDNVDSIAAGIALIWSAIQQKQLGAMTKKQNSLVR